MVKKQYECFSWFNLSVGFLKPPEAMQMFKQEKKLSEESAVIHSAIGEYYLHIGEYEKAIENFQRTLKNEPNSGWAYSVIGQCYLRMNKFLTAEEYYQEALRRKSEYR